MNDGIFSNQFIRFFLLDTCKIGTVNVLLVAVIQVTMSHMRDAGITDSFSNGSTDLDVPGLRKRCSHCQHDGPPGLVETDFFFAEFDLTGCAEDDFFIYISYFPNGKSTTWGIYRAIGNILYFLGVP